MVSLKDKVQNALDEARMLILGAQVLVGFQFGVVLNQGFGKLSVVSQYLNVAALFLMLLAVALLMAPGTYHQIVEEGRDTKGLLRYSTELMKTALLPFALAFGIDVYIVIGKIAGELVQIVAGVITFIVAMFFWYGLEMIRKYGESEHEHHSAKEKPENESNGKTELKDKIKQVLTEARVVLPGSQALLGFQFAAIVESGFDQLPASSKYVHVASLALVAISIILLMTPAAYHRIVEEGEDTEHFHRLATWVLIAAMIPLGMGICGDFFLVIRKVTGSVALALAGSITMLIFFYALWFGFTAYRRYVKAKSPRSSEYRRHASDSSLPVSR
ncbi:MAG TPA: DUF6328 family protein [Blastocatellia bacterium]|nr:DUF6328 family protein [Blastocatellia bacterium]